MEKMNLVDQTLQLYNMKNLEALATYLDIPKSTLQTWRSSKISRVGEVVLKLMIENHELREKEAIAKRFYETFAPKG